MQRPAQAEAEPGTRKPGKVPMLRPARTQAREHHARVRSLRTDSGYTVYLDEPVRPLLLDPRVVVGQQRERRGLDDEQLHSPQCAEGSALRALR